MNQNESEQLQAKLKEIVEQFRSKVNAIYDEANKRVEKTREELNSQLDQLWINSIAPIDLPIDAPAAVSDVDEPKSTPIPIVIVSTQKNNNIKKPFDTFSPASMLLSNFLPTNLMKSNSEFEQRVNLVAQLNSRVDIRDHVLSLDHKSLRSPRLDHLCEHLKRTPHFNESDMVKAWTAYLWVCKNVRFFTGRYASPQQQVKYNEVETALANGHLIGYGYCDLFKAICNKFGLECETVAGYSKGEGYELGQEMMGKFDHSWNRVLLDGHWHLLDCVWGSGYVNHLNQMVQRFQPFYFMTWPDVFIYRHWPENPTHQYLRSSPISKKCFEELPNYDLNYFLLEIKCLSHHNMYNINSDYTETYLEFEIPQRMIVIPKLFSSTTTTIGGGGESGDIVKNGCLVQRDAKSNRVSFILANLAENHVYKFRLYVEDPDKEKDLRTSVDYFVKRKENSKDGQFRMPSYDELLFHNSLLKCLSHNSNYILATRNEITMDFKEVGNNRRQLAGRLFDMASHVEYPGKVMIQRKPDNTYQLKASLPMANQKYLLHIDYEIVDYTIFLVSTKLNIPSMVAFVPDMRYVSAPNYSDLTPFLFSPLNRLIKLSVPYEFRIHVKGVDRVFIEYTNKNDRLSKHLNRDDADFNLWLLSNVTFNQDCEITLMAEKKVSETAISVYKLYSYSTSK